jgi:hypothetical protein
MIEKTAVFKVVNDVFPNVGKAIRIFWGHPEFHEYMDSLQQEKSGKIRAGFPPHILNALVDLACEHDARFPKLLPKQDDIWAVDAGRR